MKAIFIRPALSFTLAISTLCAASAVQAEYPADKPLQVISPFAAGGANDFLTRLMAKELASHFNANAVVENKVGANGIVGASYVAKAPDDGYTLMMFNVGINTALYSNLPYDAEKDFKPVSMVAVVPIVLAINSALNINSVKELIAYGKANPGKLSFGSSGIGGTGHLVGEAFKAATNLDVVHAPYKGDAPAVTDAMGGQVSMAFVSISSAASHLASGKIKILAVSHSKRLASLPDVPTMGEAGVPNLVYAAAYPLMVRSGTPQDRTQKLNTAMKDILAKESVQKGIASVGAIPLYMTPEESKKYLDNQNARLGDIIRTLGLKAK